MRPIVSLYLTTLCVRVRVRARVHAAVTGLMYGALNS